MLEFCNDNAFIQRTKIHRKHLLFDNLNAFIILYANKSKNNILYYCIIIHENEHHVFQMDTT